MTPAQIERLMLEVRHAAAKRGGSMTDSEVGALLGFTLAEAYRLARKGEAFSTIDPIEFASMTAEEQRYHRQMLTRIVREVRRK